MTQNDSSTAGAKRYTVRVPNSRISDKDFYINAMKASRREWQRIQASLEHKKIYGPSHDAEAGRSNIPIRSEHKPLIKGTRVKTSEIYFEKRDFGKPDDKGTIFLTRRPLPSIVNWANQKSWLFGISAVVFAVAWLSFFLIPGLALLTLGALWGAAFAGTAFGVTTFMRHKLYVENYLQPRDDETFWGFSKEGFRQQAHIPDMWLAGLQLLAKYYHKIHMFAEASAGLPQESAIRDSLHIAYNTYYEALRKTDRYWKYFTLSDDNPSVQATLEREFADIYNLTNSVKELYEKTITYGIEKDSSQELPPPLSEQPLESHKARLDESIKVLRELDERNGLHLGPGSVEAEIEAAALKA